MLLGCFFNAMDFHRGSLSLLLQVNRQGRSHWWWKVATCCYLMLVLLQPPVVCGAPSHSSSHCEGHDCSEENKMDVCGMGDRSDFFHRTVNVTKGIKAVDLCFVVSAASTMTGSHRWLQVAAPIIEKKLKSIDIGNDNGGGGVGNRYCIVQFGGHGEILRAHFLKVGNETFFPVNMFVSARRQLKKNGDVADGYEALMFVANSTRAFRQDPHVAKAVILVTDMGRSVLATHTELTKEKIEKALRAKGFLFDAVVQISMTLSRSGATVFGMNGSNSGIVERSEGGFEVTNDKIVFPYTARANRTFEDYVSLSTALQGSAWAIDILKVHQNIDTIASFANALVAVHRLSPISSIEQCNRCHCSGREALCSRHIDQDLCRCLINGTSIQCNEIAPTPTLSMRPDVTSLLPAIMPSPAAEVAEISGTVEETISGDTRITFGVGQQNASFKCVFLDSATPPITECTSPLVVKSSSVGSHSLLVIGTTIRETALTRLFKFRVGDRDAIKVTASRGYPDINGNVYVEFSVSKEDVTFQCSVTGSQFFECTSPHLRTRPTDGSNTEVFIILATDSSCNTATEVLTITWESSTPTTPPGPVMITYSVQPPDPRGVLTINFVTSREDVFCVCHLDFNPPFMISPPVICNNSYVADPRLIDPGTHVLTITCQDKEGNSATNRIKFNLNEPPPLPEGPFDCDLELVMPTDNSFLTANFTCNRPFTSSCQISSLQPKLCSSIYQFDTSLLDPGNHVFIWMADDGYGGSVMKVHPFFVKSVHRLCCPQIRQVVDVISDGMADLQISVAAGNCSQSEGFSYVVNWGDGASETGTRTHLSTIHTSRLYSNPGSYSIQIAYCNNPMEAAYMCCDNHFLPVLIPA